MRRNFAFCGVNQKHHVKSFIDRNTRVLKNGMRYHRFIIITLGAPPTVRTMSVKIVPMPTLFTGIATILRTNAPLHSFQEFETTIILLNSSKLTSTDITLARVTFTTLVCNASLS
jgi:hypothetical protein